MDRTFQPNQHDSQGTRWMRPQRWGHLRKKPNRLWSMINKGRVDYHTSWEEHSRLNSGHEGKTSAHQQSIDPYMFGPNHSSLILPQTQQTFPLFFQIRPPFSYLTRSKEIANWIPKNFILTEILDCLLYIQSINTALNEVRANHQQTNTATSSLTLLARARKQQKSRNRVPVASSLE